MVDLEPITFAITKQITSVDYIANSDGNTQISTIYFQIMV